MRWKLDCLLCGHQDTDLIAMQEHGMADHEITREQLQSQIRNPERLDATEYVFALPDGMGWLKATRED